MRSPVKFWPRTRSAATASTQRPPQSSDAAVNEPFESPRSNREVLARLITNLPKSAWAILDAMSVCLGHYIGYQLFSIQFPRSSWIADMTLANAVVAFSFVASGVVFGLYEGETLRHRSRITVRSLLTIALALSVSFVVMNALMYEVFSRRIAVMSPLTFLGISGSLRMLSHRLIHNMKQRILFVGCGESVCRVHRAMNESEEGQNYLLLGYVSVEPSPSSVPATELPYLGCITDIQPICRAHDVHEVVIGVEESSSAELSHMIMTCLRLGCRVTNQPIFHERVFGEVPADYITADWFLFADIDGHREERATIKRLADFILAAIGLVLSAPLWPLITLAIKLDDGGPIFYSQRRVGCHNKIFSLTKFRTMRTNAEADGHAWAVPGDTRVTRVGKILRRTHLDELPQLWNIFVGEMALVGPRPERPEFVAELIKEIPYYDERHLVKPGLTGWAQVNYRYGCSVEDSRRKLFLDLYYIKHMSLELDLVIVFRTLGTLFVSPS